ncbi:hypothetical protein E5D57_007269 [Metarhizium anisopliae]|nr:hypothetical protein E5D57_007269 [Metarhizium anisopliae]
MLSWNLRIPSQSSFESALEDNMSDGEYVSGPRHLRQSFRDAVEDMFQETGAGVVMASGESFLTTIAAGTGYPIAWPLRLQWQTTRNGDGDTQW